MSTPTALSEVMKALKEEAKRVPEIIVPFRSWAQYRERQEMWNPNWSAAGDLDFLP